MKYIVFAFGLFLAYTLSAQSEKDTAIFIPHKVQYEIEGVAFIPPYWQDR